jgi:CheY-like chemotaxis protein
MAALGTLASRVAHDFNNVLQAILGNVDCARAELPASHAALGYLEQIEIASRRAQTMVAQILALEPPPDGDNAIPAVRTPAAAGRRILVVDDEPAIGLLTSRILRRLGYEAVPFEHPEEALVVLADDPADFDLMITDYCMPRLSGAELIERARAIRPELPVIVTTGHSDAMEAEHPSLASTCHVLRKPFDGATLAHTVRGILSGANRVAVVAV